MGDLTSATMSLNASTHAESQQAFEENGDTESSSEESAPSPAASPAKRMSNVFRRSLSNLSEALEPPQAPPASPNTMQVPLCRLCEKAFQHGDDMCESSNPRCKHEFHKHCITNWLSYQNTCPCCSETFVILDV